MGMTRLFLCLALAMSVPCCVSVAGGVAAAAGHRGLPCTPRCRPEGSRAACSLRLGATLAPCLSLRGGEGEGDAGEGLRKGGVGSRSKTSRNSGRRTTKHHGHHQKREVTAGSTGAESVAFGTDQGGRNKLGTRHVRERERERERLATEVAIRGGHLTPVGRGATGSLGKGSGGSETCIVSWQDWEARGTGKWEQGRRGKTGTRSHNASVGSSAVAGPSEGVRGIRSGTSGVAPKDSKAKAERNKLRARERSKSRFQASYWVDGEERSVYGPKGPTDTDFEVMAREEMQREEEEEGGVRMTKRQREEELRRKAQEYSDTYFRLVLTGQVSLDEGKEDEVLEPDAGGTPWKGLPLPAEDTEDGKSSTFIHASHSSRESQFAAADQRDFSHYTQYELNTKLMDAAESSSVQGIVALAEAGARVDCVGKLARGWTPLFSACAQGHSLAVEALCNLGANVSARTECSNTPLHILAATSGCPNTTKVLVEFGADIDSVNEAGWTPLHCAAYTGHMGCADTLCQAGANMSAVTGQSLNASALATSVGLLRTGDALAKLADAIEGGSVRLRITKRRRPSNPVPEPSGKELGSEASESESAEEIRRNAEKVYIFSEDEEGSADSDSGSDSTGKSAMESQ